MKREVSVLAPRCIPHTASSLAQLISGQAKPS